MAPVADRLGDLVAQLSRVDDWITAGVLADRLGVTTRTVRTWVTSLRSAAAPLEVVVSGPEGYRINREALAAYRARPRDEGGTRRGRLTYLVAELAKPGAGLDLHETADILHVSESTIDADLARVRTLARESGLALERQGSTVRLAGTDAAHRQLISRLFRDEHASGALDLREVESAFPVGDLRSFKTDLIALLDADGYTVNELALDGVLVHAAIAIDRSGGAASPEPSTGRGSTELPARLGELTRRHFGVTLPEGELDALARLLLMRMGGGASDPDSVEVLRRIVHRAQDEFLVDLDDEGFIARLGLHVANLVVRARAGDPVRNPLTRSIKTSYPLTYELAVFLASELQREFGIHTTDDEIAYIALHVGVQLTRGAARDEAVSVTLVAPRYHDLADTVARSLEAELGDDIRIDLVVESTDQDPAELPGEIVVTTVADAISGDRVVAVGPFPRPPEVAAVRAAADRARRLRRRRAIADELGAYFDADLFVRCPPAASEEELIRMLGRRMLERGLIDEGHIEGAIERERLSSTAFTEILAVPHPMELTATRTAIAIAILDSPMRWGEGTVQVVAFVAFSAEGRGAFQTVFDQFVEAFADDQAARRLLADAHDVESFIESLARLIDE